MRVVHVVDFQWLITFKKHIVQVPSSSKTSHINMANTRVKDLSALLTKVTF